MYSEEMGSEDKSLFFHMAVVWLLKGRVLVSLGNEERDENTSLWQ